MKIFNKNEFLSKAVEAYEENLQIRAVALWWQNVYRNPIPGEGLFGKHYLGIIWEMARAAAISGRPGGTECDLFRILEAEEYERKIELHKNTGN